MLAKQPPQIVKIHSMLFIQCVSSSVQKINSIQTQAPMHRNRFTTCFEPIFQFKRIETNKIEVFKTTIKIVFLVYVQGLDFFIGGTCLQVCAAGAGASSPCPPLLAKVVVLSVSKYRKQLKIWISNLSIRAKHIQKELHLYEN